jgi:hypothetical protein
MYSGDSRSNRNGSRAIDWRDGSLELAHNKRARRATIPASAYELSHEPVPA